MATMKQIGKAERKALARWFPTLAEMAAVSLDSAQAAARLETLEIMMDVEQVSQLFASMEDVRLGRMVALNDAFGDL